MEKYKCLIVEDEPLAAEVLQDFIREIPFLECRGVSRDAIYASTILQNEKIDLLFLDIHLPKIKGLDFLRTLSSPPQVIITTAYREYAVEGFDLNVLDYLVKPIQFQRFLTAVNKLRQVVPLPTPNHQEASESESILINVNKKRVKLKLDEILYVESRKEYVRIFIGQTSYLTKFPISNLENELPRDRFVRIHRSFMVNKQRITAFSSSEVELGEIRLPVGRSFREHALISFGAV